MRYPKGHKDAVRARIVEAASRALRRQGLRGVSVPALMKRAGLTHGGFYGHFRSRDELVAAAIACAGEQTGDTVFGEAIGGIEATVATYLSQAHVDHPEAGCVLAALGTEAGRQPPAVRRAFARTSRGFLAGLDSKLHRKGGAAKIGDDTLALAARMIGGIVLARLVDDKRLARRILAAARKG